MRILILNWRDLKHEWAGGGEVYITELAKRWIKMGHQVTFFCGQDVRRNLPSEEIVDGMCIIRKGGRYSLYLWAVWYYLKRLRKECDVVVDVQNGIPFFSVLYSRKPKVAVVYHVHGKQFFIELPFPYSIIGYIIEKYVFPLFYHFTPIIAISKTTKSELFELGFSKKQINIVYSGINTPVNSEKLDAKFSRPTILYLGRIKKYKRVKMLVEIMPEILKEVPNTRLLVAGWGTEGGFITDVSMRSIFRKKVKIIGPVSESEKKQLLSKSWLFVNPSLREGWGISVIEANLYKTPAVAFNVPGLSESIRNQETGILVDNKEGLIKAIVQVLNDQKLRKSLSLNAYKWANTFSWDRAARESMEVLVRGTVLGSKKKSIFKLTRILNKLLPFRKVKGGINVASSVLKSSAENQS